MSVYPKSNIAVGIEFDDYKDAENFYFSIKNPETYNIEIIDIEYNTNFISTIVGINIIDMKSSFIQEIDPTKMLASLHNAYKTLNTVLNNNPEIKTWFYQGEE